jgi:hypothetical protein
MAGHYRRRATPEVIAEAHHTAQAVVTTYLEAIDGGGRDSAELGNQLLLETIESHRLLAVSQVLAVSLAQALRELARAADVEPTELWRTICVSRENDDG